MPILTNKQLLLVKQEATFNVDASPDGTNDAIQCEEPDFAPDFITLERNFIKPNWSRTAHATGRKLARISFRTEIKGGGTAGTQCKLGMLLTACGFKETVNIGTDVTYTPSSVTTDHESVTIYLYKDGLLHKITGAYGTVSFEAAVNNYGYANFEFVGQYYNPTDAALPGTYTFESTIPPQIELMNFSINGWDACISRLMIDAGVEVLPRLCANGTDGYDGTYINDRNITGGIDPEMALVADEAFWTRMSAATEMVLAAQIGATAGNIVSFDANKVQYTGLSYASRDRIQTLDAELAFNDDGSGDDELTITFT